MIELLGSLNHPNSQMCVMTERAVVRALEGDCHSPIAALAAVEGDRVNLQVAVGSRDGAPPLVTASANSGIGNTPDAVAAVIQSLQAQGVKKMLAVE